MFTRCKRTNTTRVHAETEARMRQFSFKSTPPQENDTASAKNKIYNTDDRERDEKKCNLQRNSDAHSTKQTLTT